MVDTINLLLLAVLFVAGLINFFIYLPTKSISSWFQCFSLSHKKQPAIAIAVARPVSVSVAGDPPARRRIELQKIFATFDRNDDGYITKKELVESLKNIRISMTEKELEETFNGVDSNGDGLIDFEEFCVLGERLLMAGRERGGSEEEREEDEEGELREAFCVFDKDKDGLISVEELGFVLSSLGLKEGKKSEDCREMIEKVDMDGDGMVNFDEFKKMMRSGASLVVAQA